jgi:outer membrane immunogenic protein
MMQLHGETTMKNFALGMLAAVAMTGSAFAADMAPRYAKAPPPAPIAVYTWTGCYIGGNVGGAWHNVNQNSNRNVAGTVFAPPLDLGSADSGGDFIGGGQIGCDYQFAGNWVVGIQGMFNFGDTRSSNNIFDARVIGIGAPFTTTRTRDLYTVTGRIGYLFTPPLIGYVKGGGAWTRTYTEIRGNIPAPFLSESASADRQGWTVGGGLEYMFARGWSVFGEYNYADFDRKDITFIQGPATIGVPTINSTRLNIQTALVGVNYKFNWAQPVVAKY